MWYRVAYTKIISIGTPHVLHLHPAVDLSAQQRDEYAVCVLTTITIEDS